MGRPALEVADIFRDELPDFLVDNADMPDHGLVGFGHMTNRTHLFPRHSRIGDNFVRKQEVLIEVDVREVKREIVHGIFTLEANAALRFFQCGQWFNRLIIPLNLLII